MQFNYKKTARVSEREITRAAKKLSTYFSALARAARDDSYRTDESTLYLPFDAPLRTHVRTIVSHKKKLGAQRLFVMGIGGSYLGLSAVKEALAPHDERVRIFDTIHTRSLFEGIAEIKQSFKKGKPILLNVISKSGSTNETMVNARILLGTLKKASPRWHEHVVVTTEPGSALEAWAQTRHIATLPNPQHVGGRYSVLSAVGLFPLMFAGIDTAALHHGAREMVERCMNPDSKKNPALASAALLFYHARHGCAMHNLFLFEKDLEGVGKWYRQLVGESLGKEYDLDQKKVHAGITPIISVGTQDLHSTAQLYLGGPRDKYTTFVAPPADKDIAIPTIDTMLDAIVPELNRATAREVLTATYEGTKQAYKKRRLPFAEIILDSLAAYEIGAFLQFSMIETMLLGALMRVNAFDQPNVEEYKKRTRALLRA